MIEDKLTRDERIRLEALVQANFSLQHTQTPYKYDTDVLLERARIFQDWILRGYDPERHLAELQADPLQGPLGKDRTRG